jgi:hypothetical protein
MMQTIKGLKVCRLHRCATVDLSCPHIGVTIGLERVAENDVADVLAFEEHVGLADGIGLGV